MNGKDYDGLYYQDNTGETTERESDRIRVLKILAEKQVARDVAYLRWLQKFNNWVKEHDLQQNS